MDTMTLAIAGVAALAILLIAVGIATSGRIGHLRPPRALRRRSRTRPRPPPTGQGAVADLIAQSRPSPASTRSSSSATSAPTCRARSPAPTSSSSRREYLLIWAGSHRRRAGRRCSCCRSFLPTLGNPIFLLIGGLVGFFLPRFWLGRRKNGRLNAFNKQLPDTITLIANALRAGSSFLQAIELVVRESRPPISTEFGRVIREVNLGLPFDQALENMVRRVRSDDLELMATAISIQHQVGGNLAEILDSIAFTIRERVRIKGEIRTLTAQQRLSGYVVGFLPIGLAGFLFIAAPGFMEPMFAKPPEVLGLPAGVIILLFGGFMMFIGFMFIRKIVDIEV